MPAKSRRQRRRGRTSWLVGRLGLSKSDYPPERRGFIAIQIDGLGYFVLKSALTRRYAPHLRKLVKRRGFRLQRYRVGLPSTTPASQLGMMYGDNYGVPGFRWVEKATRSIKITKSASVCAEVEKRVRERSKRGGALKHGSSYCNMFSGDAESSTLTLSTLGSARHFRLRWRDLLIFSVLMIGLVARVIVLSLWEALVELFDHLKALQDGRRVRDEGVFPIVRAVTNVVFREIATQGCLLDVYRGVPFVFLNYSGYDEVAHHRGPNSIYAKIVLRGIDAQVKRIQRAIERFGAREYDLILLSDHGQATTIPWEQLHGQPLIEFILERVASARLLPIGADHRAKQVGRAFAFTAWLQEMEWTLPRPLNRLARSAAHWLKERLPDEATGIDWSDEAEILLAPTGSLAHLYFTSKPEPLTIDEIRTSHAKLVDALVAHPSIAAVAARTASGGVELRSAHGSLAFGPGEARRLVGEHPLESFIEGAEMESEVLRLATMPHAGDLILLSAKYQGRVVNFQMEMGSHGGMHLEEQAGFIMAPPELDFDLSTVRSVRDIYRIFIRYHDDEVVAAPPVDESRVAVT